MKLMKLLLLAAALCLPAAPIFAEAELEARIWSVELDGELVVSQGGLGTNIKLPQDLGISDEEALEIRLTWRLPGPMVIRFGYMPLSYSGDATLDETVEFAGISFPIAFDVSSNLDIDYARVGLGWLFRVNDDFRIGPMLEAKVLRAEAELRGSILGLPLISAKDSQDVAFLSLGGAFDVQPIPKLHITGEAGYSPGLDFGELIEAEVGVKFQPLDIVSVFGGYRLITLDLDDEDDRLDLDLSGPYLGASLSF